MMSRKALVWVFAAGALVAAAPAGGARAAGQHHGGQHMSGGQIAGAVAEAVRQATWRYRNFDVLVGEGGWTPVPGCVSGPEEGAMGVHFARLERFDRVLDIENPEVLVYEPKKSGRLELVAAEYIAPQVPWETANPGIQPVLAGQLLHFINGPNRYGPDAFYELHVWAWKANPRGLFADFNPNVTCAFFQGES
jgi:hypothetical protein